jgi:hypothetical protein
MGEGRLHFLTEETGSLTSRDGLRRMSLRPLATFLATLRCMSLRPLRCMSLRPLRPVLATLATLRPDRQAGMACAVCPCDPCAVCPCDPVLATLSLRPPGDRRRAGALHRSAAGLPRPDQALDRPAKANDPGRNRGVCSPVVLELSPPGGHLRDGAEPGSGGGRRVARPRCPWPAHRRRLSHADDSLGQHQRPQHHDRGVRVPADCGRLSGSLPLEGETRSHPSTRTALTGRSRAAGHARWSSLRGYQTALSRFFLVFCRCLLDR